MLFADKPATLPDRFARHGYGQVCLHHHPRPAPANQQPEKAGKAHPKPSFDSEGRGMVAVVAMKEDGGRDKWIGNILIDPASGKLPV